MTRSNWKRYDGENAKILASQYEKLDTAKVLAWVIDRLPKDKKKLTILDVGAGSGRDSAWFSKQGHEVIALEPCESMMIEAKNYHPDEPVHWISDSLPSLEKVERLSFSFDVILLSAVWMHIAEKDRERAFRKLVSLLKPGGIMAFSLRQGPPQEEDGFHIIHPDEVISLAKERGLNTIFIGKEDDFLLRNKVFWDYLIFKLPDDGTVALPLIRHIILNDKKSSSFKLGLMRVLARIAINAQGLAHYQEKDVALPLGLIALYWIRIYKPLISAGLPQSPALTGEKGLSFVKEAWHEINDISPFDLKIGTNFLQEKAQHLHQALKDSVQTIVKMLAHFLHGQEQMNKL